MRAHVSAVAETSPAAVLRRACDCHAQTPGDEMCPACAAKAAGVQPRLVIGPADDPFEREAEAVSEQVAVGRAGPIGRGAPSATVIQQKPAASAHQAAAPAAAGAVAFGGAPLSDADRAYFEPRFGHDLGHVRLHTDAGAGRAAQAIGARAYTLRNHIAFAPGQFAPGTGEGRRLIAHELTHTLQQGAATLRRLPLDLVRMEQDLGPHDQMPGASGLTPDQRVPRDTIMSYAEATALNDCQGRKGWDEINRAECLQEVLGIPVPVWKSVPGISSPVPFRAGVAAGTATTTIGSVSLTILPDANSTDAAMTGAQTSINFAPMAPGTNGISWMSHGGTVTSFVFNQDYFALTIQTTYGPSASPGGNSAYGRGTTPGDKLENETSLGFHEGEHGRDFITYLQDNPYPVFGGKTGQTTPVFEGHVTTFTGAVAAYVKRMTRLSELRTDCAGKSIDTFKAETGTATTMCVRKRGDPTP